MVRIPSDREPTHPGDVLLNDFLIPLGMTHTIWPAPSTCPTSASTVRGDLCTTVLPAQVDLCATVLPAQAGIQL